MAMGRFPCGLAISMEDIPAMDALYVRICDAGEDPTQHKQLIEGLRARNYTDEGNKRLQYWELCDTAEGRFLLYQTPKQKFLTNAKSNLATLFQRTGLDATLAGGLRYIDLEGLAVLGLLSEPTREEENEDEIPERFRLKEKPTWEEYEAQLKQAGEDPTDAPKNWAWQVGHVKRMSLSPGRCQYA